MENYNYSNPLIANYECDGQLDIFSFMAQTQEIITQDIESEKHFTEKKITN